MGLSYEVKFKVNGELVDEQAAIGGYFALIVNGRSHPVELSHPIEAEIAKEYGYSLITAALKGRLLYVSEVICLDCGALGISPKLVFERGMSFVAGLTACLVMVCLDIDYGFFMTLFAYYFAFLTFMLGPSMLVRMIYWKRHRAHAKPHCGRCGSKRRRSVEWCSGREYVYGKEPGQSFSVETVGFC